jgi:hypothetical protein
MASYCMWMAEGGMILGFYGGPGTDMLKNG